MTNAGFREEAAATNVEEVGLSHLSLELGHLYMEDFKAGPDRLRKHFQKVRPWVDAARSIAVAESGAAKPRVSTCFLIDDYFGHLSSPDKVLSDLLNAAQDSGLTIDYIVRESACAVLNGAPLAEMVAGRLIPLPAPGTNGSRPPPTQIGWLCNGEHSPGVDSNEAMRSPTWQPPRETESPNHSIFVDVELWSDSNGARTWSCAFLASVWHLLRLGVIRNSGRNVVVPVPMTSKLPDRWDALPPILQVNDKASSFCAYRTLSVLPARFIRVEHAVQVIVNQYSALPAVIDQIAIRSRREGFPLPPDLTERIDHIFVNGG